jgi:LacI family transcriptional regulator
MERRRFGDSRLGGTVRLVDVAEAAGVSIATASRSLTGRDGVSPEAAEHVRRVAEELGYVANPQARTLAGGTASVAGMLVYEINDPFFAEIAGGAMRVADKNGWIVQISSTARETDAEVPQIRLLRAHRVGAIVVTGSGYVDPEMEAEADRELALFQARGGRAVVVGRHHLTCDAVLPDNEGAGRAVAEHVLGLGHRRLAVAAGPARLTTVADRLAGIRAGLEAFGVDPAGVPVVHDDFTREGGRAAAGRILAAHPDVTAVLALNDVMAAGVLSLFRERGKNVPRDISVTGFDDIQVAQDLAPALTTAHLPMSDIGAWAMEMVLKPAAQRPRRKKTGFELTVRSSTAPPAR